MTMTVITLQTVINAPRERIFLAHYMRRFLVERNAVLKRTAESNHWRTYLPTDGMPNQAPRPVAPASCTPDASAFAEPTAGRTLFAKPSTSAGPTADKTANKDTPVAPPPRAVGH